MAKYRIIGKMFIAPWVYDPERDPQMCAEVTLPDDFVPNFNMEPLDDAARKAYDAYRKKKEETPGVVVPGANGRATVNPVDALPLKGETPEQLSARAPLNPGAKGTIDAPSAENPSALSPPSPPPASAAIGPETPKTEAGETTPASGEKNPPDLKSIVGGP